MSNKLKALGLSLLASMAVSAVVVMNAVANGEGHFVSEEAHTVIKGTEGPGENHRHHFIDEDFPDSKIGCSTVSYLGTTDKVKVTEVVIAPAYSNCSTTGAENLTVSVNGCTYKFTAAKNTNDNTEQTVHLICPVGKKIEIKHPSCTISVHPQTINTGITYTHKTNANGKTEITLDTHATFSITRHGLCQFVVPTNGFGELVGSATVQGFHKEGAQRSITAT